MHWSKKNKLITLWLIKLQSNADFNKIYYWHARLRSRIISQKCSIQCTGIPSRVSHHRRDWAVPTALRFVTKSFCFIHYNKALNTFIAVFLHSWVRKRCTGNSSSNNTSRNEQINSVSYLHLQRAVHTSNLIKLHCLTQFSATNEPHTENVQAHMHTVQQVCVSMLPAGEFLCSPFTIWFSEEGALHVCLSQYSMCAFIQVSMRTEPTQGNMGEGLLVLFSGKRWAASHLKLISSSWSHIS